MCSRNLIEFALVDDLHCDLLTGENMPGELYYGEMTTAKRLLQVVEAGNLAIIVAVPHPPMHLVSLKWGNEPWMVDRIAQRWNLFRSNPFLEVLTIMEIGWMWLKVVTMIYDGRLISWSREWCRSYCSSDEININVFFFINPYTSIYSFLHKYKWELIFIFLTFFTIFLTHNKIYE